MAQTASDLVYAKRRKGMYTNKGRYPKKDVEQIEKSMKLLKSMEKRNKLDFINIFRAANTIIDCMKENTIVNLRRQGYSIRKIARSIHMDDGRVSAILKENNAFRKVRKS
jgi:predicted transcriptional regulator